MKIANIGTDSLYHLTSGDNFRRITKNGGILMSTDRAFGKESVLTGVFMIDLPNFVKNWRFSKDWKGHLGYSLLKHISLNSDEIVCLKINTKGFKTQDMYIRSQNELCRCALQNKGNREAALNGLGINQTDMIPETDALEYIYEHSIESERINLIGKIKMNTINQNPITDREKEACATAALKELFKNAPERRLLDIYS